VAGKIHSQGHSRPAFGNLRSRAPGSDPVGAASQVGLVLTLHLLQVLGEASLRHGVQDGHAVRGALGVADDDLVRPEVEVLESQAAFEQAQPGAIQEGGHEAARAVQYGDDPRTSSRVRTMGRRFGRLARTTSSSQGTSWCRTWR
jgi:hypothetical protein